MVLEEVKEVVGYIETIFRDSPDEKVYEIKLTEKLDGRIRAIIKGKDLPIGNVLYRFIVDKANVERDKNNKKRTILHVLNVIPDIEDTELDIKLFLVSIKGISYKIADNIYDIFGDNTFKVIQEEPNQLLVVKGITPKKIESICSEFSALQIEKQIKLKFGEWGLFINGEAIKKIKAFFARRKWSFEGGMRRIADNIYMLTELNVFAFKDIDTIRTSMNIDELSPLRIRAASIDILHKAFKNGVMQMQLSVLVEKTMQILEFKQCAETANKIEKTIKETPLMICDSDIVMAKDVSNIEDQVVHRLILGMQKKELNSFDSEKLKDIFDEFRMDGIQISEDQENAIRNALTCGVSVLTGGPGTGKTTLVNLISQVYSRIYPRREQNYVAFSGKAARHLGKTVGINGQTIHACFRLGIDEDIFNFLPRECRTGLLVIDEASMLGLDLFYYILSSIGINTNIVFVGDVNQLPPIGAGQVFKDIIDSDIFKVSKLVHRYRTNENSLISYNAELVKNRQMKLCEGPDFEIFRIPKDNSNMLKQAEDIIVDCYIKAINNEVIGEVVALSPVNNGICGVNSLNKRFQPLVNNIVSSSSFPLADGSFINVGDKVICIKNNKEVMNGDVGRVINITTNLMDTTKQVVVVDFGGLVYSFEKNNNDELMLAYAMTVHKSQGSEYDIVILPCLEEFEHLTKKMLYTAITRAKKKVIIVTDDELVGLKQALSTDEEKSSKFISKLINYKEEPNIYGEVEVANIAEIPMLDDTDENAIISKKDISIQEDDIQLTIFDFI